MAFRGTEPLRTNVIIEEPIDQVSHFNYLRNDIRYDKDYDIDI